MEKPTIIIRIKIRKMMIIISMFSSSTRALGWGALSCALWQNLATRCWRCSQGDNMHCSHASLQQWSSGRLRSRWRSSARRGKPIAGWIASTVIASIALITSKWSHIIIFQHYYHFHGHHSLYHHRLCALFWSFSSRRTVCQRYNHLQKPGVSRTMIHGSICTPLSPWHSPPFFLYSTLSPVLILCRCVSVQYDKPFNWIKFQFIKHVSGCVCAVFNLIKFQFIKHVSVCVQYDKPCCTNDVTEDCESMDQSCAWEQTCK